MSMGEGTLDLESLPGVYEAFTLEHTVQGLYFLLGPTGDIGDGSLVDGIAFSPSFPDEDRGPRVSIWDAIDIHGNINTAFILLCQEKNRTIHGNNWKDLK